jgi:hypothetical protein
MDYNRVVQLFSFLGPKIVFPMDHGQRRIPYRKLIANFFISNIKYLEMSNYINTVYDQILNVSQITLKSHAILKVLLQQLPFDTVLA